MTTLVLAGYLIVVPSVLPSNVPAFAQEGVNPRPAPVPLDPRAAELAAWARRTPSEEGKAAVAAGLLDSSPSVRGEALGVIFTWADAAARRGPGERTAALSGVRSLQDAAEQLLDDPVPDVRYRAVLVVTRRDMAGSDGRLAPATTARFIEQLKVERDKRVRAELFKSLALATQDPDAVLPLLVSGLEDQDPKIRQSAALGLRRLTIDGPTTKLLIDRLRDSDAAVRLAAATALHRFRSVAGVEAAIREAAAVERNLQVRQALEGILTSP